MSVRAEKLRAVHAEGPITKRRAFGGAGNNTDVLGHDDRVSGCGGGETSLTRGRRPITHVFELRPLLPLRPAVRRGQLAADLIEQLYILGGAPQVPVG